MWVSCDDYTFLIDRLHCHLSFCTCRQILKRRTFTNHLSRTRADAAITNIISCTKLRLNDLKIDRIMRITITPKYEKRNYIIRSYINVVSYYYCYTLTKPFLRTNTTHTLCLEKLKVRVSVLIIKKETIPFLLLPLGLPSQKKKKKKKNH